MYNWQKQVNQEGSPYSPHNCFHLCSGIKTDKNAQQITGGKKKKPANNKTQRLQLLWKVSYIIQKYWHHSQTSSGTFCGRWEAPVAQTHMYQQLERPGQCRFYHCAVCTFHMLLCGLCHQESKEPFLQFITNLNSHTVKKQFVVETQTAIDKSYPRKKSRTAEKLNGEWEQLQDE